MILKFFFAFLLFFVGGGGVNSAEVREEIHNNQNVRVFVTTFVDLHSEDPLTYMMVDFIFAPTFAVTKSQIAVLYVNRVRVDEVELDESVRKGTLEGPLEYLVGNMQVRVDIVENSFPEIIVESTRVILTGYGNLTLKFRDSIVDPASWLPVHIDEETGKNWRGKPPVLMKKHPGPQGESTPAPLLGLGSILHGKKPCFRAPEFHSENITAKQLWDELSEDAINLIGWFSPNTMHSRMLDNSYIDRFNASYETGYLPNGCFSGSIFPCRCKYPEVRNLGCLALWNATVNETTHFPHDLPWVYIPGMGQRLVEPHHKKIYFFARQWVQNHQHFLMDWLGPSAPAIGELISDPDVLFVAPYQGLARQLLDAMGLKHRIIPFVSDAAYCGEHSYYPIWNFTGNDYIMRTPEMLVAANAIVNYLLPSTYAGWPQRNVVVYITRSGQVTGRNVFNEQEVIDTIKDAVDSTSDFKLEIADPGKMALNLRIELFRRARIVIGMHGGAMANLVFTQMYPFVSCNDTTSVIEFASQDHLVAETSYDQPFLSYWYRGYAAVLRYHLVGYYGNPAEPIVDVVGLKSALSQTLREHAKVSV